MKPSCINFIVCVICEVFRNEFRKYIFYVQCVYLCILYFTCDVLNSFRNRFCEARPVNLECRVLTRDSYPFFFFSILLYSLLQVTLLIANFQHLAPIEGFRSRSQPFLSGPVIVCLVAPNRLECGCMFQKLIWFLT